jgi:hypothetical protein
VPADHRSAHPNIAGVPWWGAVLLAVTAAAIGFAFDAGSGNRELSFVFSACYALGCVLAVLAVRQTAVFTAVVQPPLILFVMVPGAYFLFHGGQLTGLKDTLINCGYPLIERFPLMFFTSAAVLLLGMARWYYGASSRRPAPKTTSKSGIMAFLTARMSGLVTPPEDEADAAETPRRRHSVDRPARATKARPSSARRPAKRTTPSRSRHARPPETEIIEPVVDRPRPPRSTRRTEPPPVPPAEPRRRSRSRSTGEPRKQPPADRRGAHERPERRRRRFEDHEPLEPHGTNGSAAGSSTHHPISRVRYRSVDDGDNRAEYRTRPRSPRSWDAWEYDV